MPTALQSGSLKLLEPSGPVQTCNGIAVPFFTFFFNLLSPSDRAFAITYPKQTMFLRYTYNITAILCLQCMVHATLLPMTNNLYFYITTFRSMCAAPSIVVCDVIIYCQSPLCKVLTITPGTNHVSTVHSFTAVLCLQFMAHVMLFLMISHDKCSLFVY